MEKQVELNGHSITNEDVRQYLKAKKAILWSDWCVTQPDRMDIAVDWFMGEMAGLAASLS